jgi:hypothetical protein
MRITELQGLAENLAVMACSERLQPDLERLAALPDGTVVYDLKSGCAEHSASTDENLLSAQELAKWFANQLVSRKFEPSRIEHALVRLTIDTSDPPTVKEKIISFRLRSTVTLRSSGREFSADAQNHFWHTRPEATQ